MRQAMLMVGVIGLVFWLGGQAGAQGKKKPKTPAVSEFKDAFGDALPAGAIARIGTVRYRLPDSRGMIATTPDGKLLAALGPNGDIELWELPAWKRRRAIAPFDFERKGITFQGLAFSADGKKLATSDPTDGKAYLLDVATGKPLKRLDFPEKDSVQTAFLAWSQDEKTLIGAYANGNAKNVLIVWDLSMGKSVRIPLPDQQRPMGGNGVSMSDDGRLFAVSVIDENPARQGNGLETRLEIFDLVKGKSLHKIVLDTAIPRIALSADGKWLAAANDSSLLRIYDAAAGKEVHNIRGRYPIDHLQFAADGSLYVGDYAGNIQRWDAAKGERVAEWKAPGRFGVSRLMFPPGGKMLAMSTVTDAVHFWEVETGKVFSPSGLPADPINEVEFSPKGELFVASEGGMTAWWDPRTGKKLRDLKLEAADGTDRMLPLLRFDDPLIERRLGSRRRDIPALGALFGMTQNAEFLANGNGDSIVFYDAKTGKILYEESADRNGGMSPEIAFLERGARSAALTGKKVRIWNTRTGRDVASFNIPLRDQESAVRFGASPTGKYFAIAALTQAENGGGRILLWDAANKKALREWTAAANGVDALVFSPDEKWFAASKPQERIQLSRVGAGRADYELGAMDEQFDYMQVLFAPDSRLLACTQERVSDNNVARSRIQIFEIASKKLRLEFAGHPSGFIDRLAWSPDSTLLASAATDTTALVWKVGLRAYLDRPDEKTPAADLDGLYTKLAGKDAKAAFQAMIQLGRAPKETIKLLAEKIAPARAPDSGEKSIKQWIRDLGNPQFTVRSKANNALQKLGPAAEPELRHALESVKDIESRRRIGELLERIEMHEWTADEILHARAAELLEAIGTPEARAVLSRWSAGDPAAILTTEAKKALAAPAN